MLLSLRPSVNDEGTDMLERNTYPPGVPCWIDTVRPDPQAAKSFYGGLFGWEYDERTPPGAPEPYFVAQIRGRDVAGIGTQADGAAPEWNTYVAVDSADDAAAKARDAGGAVLMGPFDVGEAGRMAVLADLSGAVVCVWQANQTKGSQIVNEPGAWNFSELNTPDPEGAKGFYGDVFGWETSNLGDTSFWCMPGYGDFLDQLNPGTRAGMAEMGAPERFEDAVAWLVPTPADDTPPHWSTTFGVANADATAARAEELGGTVLSPPTDAPWVRMTVLRDPQGAVFTASQFTPPE